VVYC